MNIGIIILAAGESKRMGFPKQLLPVNNKTLLLQLIEAALDTRIGPITVVVGAHKDKIVPIFENIPINIIDNAHWQSGISSSIKMGMVGTYMVNKEIEGVILLTSDMPNVTTAFIEKLADLSKEKQDVDIIATGYQNTVGIPTFFRRNMFEKLLELKNDEGAKKIILESKEKVFVIKNEVVGIDLDTKEDYLNFINSKN